MRGVAPSHTSLKEPGEWTAVFLEGRSMLRPYSTR